MFRGRRTCFREAWNRVAYFVGLWAWMLAWDAAGADWPQWRGPERNSISTGSISRRWPVQGPPVLWRTNVGIGFSSVSVGDGRAYTLGNTNQHDTVWCFDALTGRELWHHSYPAKLDPQYYEGGPTSTPTFANGQLFTISKWGDVFCFDAANGTVIWHHEFGRDGVRSNRWGFAGSPLVWRDLLILNAGESGAALERATGRVAWLNGTNPGGYASPVLFRSGGQEAVLIFAAKRLVALDPLTGRELWSHPWKTQWDTNNSDPLVHPAGIFISSFTRGCALLSIEQGRPEVRYDNQNLRNHLSPAVLLGDYLYAFNGEAHKLTDFRCLHLPTGEIKWTIKDPAFGSVICAGGLLVILTEKGELMLAEPSPREFKPLARAKVLTGTCWTPPSLANGRLYVRNATGDLVCLDLRP